MKKGILLIAGLLMSMSVFAASFKKGNTVYVSSKTAALKNGSGLFAKDVATVNYGDQLKVLSVSGKKVEVQSTTNSKITGWIASGSITTKKIVKTTSGGSVNASAKEIALAGKGFSEETEGIYQSSNSKLDFSLVDSIEAIVISDSEMEKFIKEGHLKGAE